MARIVRNNRIFENNQSEWNSNIHIMSTPVKFVRLYAVCRYIKRLIEENECSGLVSVDVVLNGKGFTKGFIVFIFTSKIPNLLYHICLNFKSKYKNVFNFIFQRRFKFQICIGKN